MNSPTGWLTIEKADGTTKQIPRWSEISGDAVVMGDG